ncbi:MAG: carbamoyl phosphate synthase small subunit [Clostridiales bacterium]|nr:carbamoyl phosphate synthase small subunit [Clostridiales bacterium]
MDRYIVLENGMVFRGKAFGAEKEVIAELVFSTGMTAYVETLTDPSYYGQAIVQTFPLLGDYGVMAADAESGMNGPWAYIVREWCEKPSNFRSEGDIDTYLRQAGIPGVYGIDTRALTRVLRENGVMNCAVTADPASVDMDKLKAYRVTGAVAETCAKQIEQRKSENGKYNVAVIDLGLKNYIARRLLERDCDLTIVPGTVSAGEILAMKPDGIVISNGPGDPADNAAIVEELKTLVKSGVPMFGIALGHQLLALAHDFRTEKLKYGHHGANQPVKYYKDGHVYISAQNHGYAVVPESIKPDTAVQSFVNVNDGTNEGIEYRNKPVFSVQFYPEASGGSKDTGFLFDKFVDMMKGV